jgi:hypothetical protein
VEEVPVEDVGPEAAEELHERRHAREVDLRADAEHVDRDARRAEVARERSVLAAEAPEREDVRVEPPAVETRRELEDDALGARGTELGDHEDDADHASASR